MQTTQTVRLQTNEQALLKNLKLSFSNSYTVITELLQNARRAQASHIYVDFDKEQQTLSVIDDGIGIDNFQKLLTVAESGWNETIVENEHCFGMGFLSAIFACEHCTIKSQGRHIAFATNDALSFAEAHVEKSDFIGSGTQIFMRGCKDNVLGDIKKLVRGFPVPVIFNGNELERDHAVNESFLNTNVGRMALEGLNDGRYLNGGNLYIYLQGFLVKHDLYPPFSGIIHLDSRKYLDIMY